MVAASELGDAAVTVPVILVVLAWLVWQRRLRSAAYWISAVAVAKLFVVTLKFVMRRARPSSIYEGLQGFSFPSNHATLSVVTYGFLAFFVARAWGNVAQRRIATATTPVHSPHFVFTPLPGCPLVLRCARGSQLRRGMDSDSGRASSRWRRKSNRRVFARCVAPFVTFVTSATVHIVMQHAFDLSLYAPR
jgi:hypothetical protein